MWSDAALIRPYPNPPRSKHPAGPPARPPAAAVVQYAAKRVQRERVKGSATCCVVLLDMLQGRLASANLGDSGVIVLGEPLGR